MDSILWIYIWKHSLELRLRATISFIILFLFWVIWSGFFDPFHLTLGALSTLVVVLWTSDLLVKEQRPISQRLREFIQFEIYSFWLSWQIILANIDVLKLAFSRNLNDVLNPSIVDLKSTAGGDLPIFLIANSITLTPGTVTVRAKKNHLLIHAINDDAAAGLKEIDTRVSQIFKETS